MALASAPPDAEASLDEGGKRENMSSVSRNTDGNSDGSDKGAGGPSESSPTGPPKLRPKAGGKVNLFDPAATASRWVTRRFGIVGGLGFVALLASVEGFEIFKAATEKESEGDGVTVTLPSGLTYRDIKVR